MFNRLPIYSRPKEPAIGEPVLTRSTNLRLADTRVGNAGFDTYPSLRSQQANDKGLPRLPTPDLSHNDYLGNSSLLPPRIDSLRYANTESYPPRLPPTDPSPIYIPAVAPAPPRKFNVNRKPAPSPSSTPPLPPAPVSFYAPPSHSFLGAAGDSGFGTTSTITAGQGKRGTSHAIHQTPSGAAPSKPSTFTFGNLVKEKVTGRRKNSLSSAELLQPAPSPEPDFELPVHPVKPANLVSIDDWLDQREKFHRRSNTVSTVSTQHSRHKDPLKLHIRQSTFAPLHPPDELLPDVPPLPPMPAVPQEYRSQRTGTTTPPRNISRPAPVARSSQISSPPTPPPSVIRESNMNKPMDRISQLELEQERLETQRYDLRKEIYDLEQLLPPNPSTHNPAVRDQMRGKVEGLRPKLADVEKEIHETGLKLRRAIRRREKREGYEPPTHLWISRVTARDDD